MGHLPKLIEDLALILITGAVTTLLFRSIKQPLILGYIIAGLLVGPYMALTPTVVDSSNVKILADIGVIFLLFSLGIEFSFKKLIRIGGSSSLTAFFEILVIVLAGYLAGRAMHWSVMDSIFLGGMMASSSTTMIIKAFEEFGLKTRRYARVVFGVLVVEDIVVILLMVLLSTVAVTKQFAGTAMLLTVFKLLFFLSLWFITGIFLLPTLLKTVRELLDEETLLILSIGLCLGMVIVAMSAGFSAELGAFIMGSLFAETTRAEKVEHLVKPVRDLFGAVFFVSVGMMINPAIIWQYRWSVLWVTLLAIVGKSISTTAGALISGQPLRQSIQVGMSMAQIGEFAFIVAGLGVSLKVTSDFLFPVAVGASAITTFIMPFMIRYSDRFYHLIVPLLPTGLLNAINSYSASTQKIQAEGHWKTVVNAYINMVLINLIIIIALTGLSTRFLFPFISREVPGQFAAALLTLVISLIIASPFFWALMVKRPHNMGYKELWLDKRYSHGPLVVLEVSRNLIGVILLSFWVGEVFSTAVAILVTVPVTVFVLVLFSKRLQSFYQRIEVRFLHNLNSRESGADEEMPASDLPLEVYSESDQFPWEAHIVDLAVNPLAPYTGKPLRELGWREQYGINVAYIKRGDKLIPAPGALDKLLPYDRVGIIATDAQLHTFKPIFDSRDHKNMEELEMEDIVLQKIIINKHNRLQGLSIKDSCIAEKTKGLVVGIEKNGKRILNPQSSVLLEWNDVVWIVGDRNKIQDIAREDVYQESSFSQARTS